MKITFDKNVYSPGEIGDITDGPIVQKGTEKTTIFKTHFFSIGEVAKIHEINGTPERTFWERLSPQKNLPISRYSLEVSIWKVVALIIFVLPITFLEAIFNGKAITSLSRTVTQNNVRIEISKEQNGKHSIKTETIAPIDIDWGRFLIDII